MRRLTLILSDLYLPEDHAQGDVPETHALPALQWLLGQADRPRFIGDWRQWLLSAVESSAVLPPGATVAQVCAHAAQVEAGEGAWIATPVNLEAHVDHVRLADQGLLRLLPEERARWCAQFAHDFGPRFALHEWGARGFLLTGLPPAPTADPARLLGSGIESGLPGRDSPEARRLWAEIEMWLHASPLNTAREQAGHRRVSALWLWGAGARAEGSRGVRLRNVRWHGEDPLILALSSAADDHAEVAAISAFSQLEASPQETIAEFAPLTGSAAETLPMLEAHWFAPARMALARGELDALTIIANDRLFRVGRFARWRIWRSRRHWLPLLAAAVTKA
jgi:hypothetical protein